MRGSSSIQVVLGFLPIIGISPCFSAEPNAPCSKSSKYLHAVHEFAGKVLKYGWDTESDSTISMELSVRGLDTLSRV
jgi:hypothetical protein